MITSKDVAKAAHVSISTISRVFSQPHLVNEETRNRVLEISKKLNYIPNNNAKFLKLSKSNVIGYVIPDINNRFYLQIPRDLSFLSENTNNHISLMFSNEDENIEFNNIKSLVSTNTKAIIFVPTGNSLEETKNMITCNNIPSIQLFRKKFESIDSLTIDDEYGTYLAVRELINAGHTRIMLVDYSVQIPTNRDKGYKRAYKEANLQYDENLIYKVNIMSNYREELNQRIKSLNPTAIVPISNILLEEILNIFKNQNIEIGKDMSVVAYDDCEIASYMNITCIAHPYPEISKMTSLMINQRISQPNLPPQHAIIKPYLIPRNSIKKHD